MTTIEFFDQYLARRILPTDKITDDPLTNVRNLEESVGMANGRKDRLQQTWLVVTPERVVTKAKLAPAQNVISGSSDPMHQVAAHAIAQGPAGIIQLDKKSFRAGSLFVTRDPRAITICTNTGPVFSGSMVAKIEKEIECMTQ